MNQLEYQIMLQLEVVLHVPVRVLDPVVPSVNELYYAPAEEKYGLGQFDIDYNVFNAQEHSDTLHGEIEDEDELDWDLDRQGVKYRLLGKLTILWSKSTYTTSRCWAVVRLSTEMAIL